MVPDRFAITPGLPVRASCTSAVQLQLARNHRLCEVTFADKVRNDVNIFDRVGIKKKDRVPQTWFLFPKRTRDFAEDISTPDFGRMGQRRRARIWVHRRAMADNQQRGVRSEFHESNFTTENAEATEDQKPISLRDLRALCGKMFPCVSAPTKTRI